jgi:hypothetical protein
MDGYVLDFHDGEQGIFSTRIGTALVNGIGNQIVGKKILFKKAGKSNDNSTLNFISKEWQTKANFQNSIRNAIKYAVGLGTSLLKVNKSGPDLWLEALRLDNFYFESDFRGNLVEVTCMLKKYSATLVDKKENEYYLVERRFFKKVKTKSVNQINGKWQTFEAIEREPYVEYLVHRYNGQTMNNQSYDPNLKQDISWKSVPSNVRDSIMRDYNLIQIGVPQKLPFKDWLGCELLKFDDGDITLPQIPFGTSALSDIIAYLMTYDLAWSYYMRDMYQGKGFVLLPKNFAKVLDRAKAGAFGGLDESLYQNYSTTDPDKAKPEKVQFELRAEEWERIQDNILKKIATQKGLSPKTIASYLTQATSQKTATEIDAEDDSTIAYIETKRGIFEIPINNLLEKVLNYYGKCENVEVKFATPTLVNKDKVIDREIRKLDAGLTTPEEAIKAIYDEDDEEQIQERISKLVKYKEAEEAKQIANPMNY